MNDRDLYPRKKRNIKNSYDKKILIRILFSRIVTIHPTIFRMEENYYKSCKMIEVVTARIDKQSTSTTTLKLTTTTSSS